MSPRKYLVTYELVNRDTKLAYANGKIEVSGVNATEAREAARTWVREHDQRYDPRIDAGIRLVNCQRHV